MGICIITFRSVTPAQRAERLLKNVGLSCNMGRTPRWMEQQGCGYSLRVRFADAETVAALLRSNKVAFRKIYLQRENGNLEELEL